MSIIREIPPTAGFPLSAKDFLSFFSKTTRQGSLEKDFKNYLGVPFAQVTYSGTAALYLILETLKDFSLKKTVVIPSFVCPLVPLAIKRAGLKVTVCDINKEDFNFDILQLQELCLRNSDILAIIAVHLGGIPIDFEAIKHIAEKNKIFIIEDCAQSLGAVYKGKMVGTQGEFSFFSLCRGKGLTIYEGGLIVTKDKDYSTGIDNTIKRIMRDDVLSESLKILELFGYWIFYRPRLFWFVYRLPQIFWDWRGQHLRALTEYFTVDFPLHKVSRFRKSIGHAIFYRLEEEINKQREKAFDYIKGLRKVQQIRPITESPETKAIYPYLTLLFDDPEKRNKVLKIFRNSGLGVSSIYASAITDYEYLRDVIENKDCPNARYLAQRQITLSTSTFLKKRDLDYIVEIIKKL